MMVAVIQRSVVAHGALGVGGPAHVSQLYAAEEAQCDVHMSQQHPPCAGAESARCSCGRERASLKRLCAKTGGCANE